jgi:hypothetical protein
MIVYVRGRLHGSVADGIAEVVTDDGAIPSIVLGDPGRMHAGTSVVIARTQFETGVSRRDLDLLLGPWIPAEADPGSPLGLASTPVVVLTGGPLGDLVRAGAHRAGRSPTIATAEGHAPSLGLVLLDAVANGADALVVEHGGPETLRLVRVLGGRPLASLPLEQATELAGLFDDLDLDVYVPVPSREEPMRTRIRSLLAPFDLETLHHLVEVDPAPAFDELLRDAGDADLDELAAAAAGVLAGRLAATDRRWRQDLDA